MTDWLNTETGKQFFEKAFETAGLPEVDESELEVGTYTNRQIAEMIGDPAELLILLIDLPGTDPASKRSMFSFAAEMIRDKTNLYPQDWNRASMGMKCLPLFLDTQNDFEIEVP